MNEMMVSWESIDPRCDHDELISRLTDLGYTILEENEGFTITFDA